MGSACMTWEDEENNRQIRFRVDYTIGNSEIEIVDVVPTEVIFEDSRCVGIHTAKGRDMLLKQIQRSGRIETLKSEIAELDELLAVV